MHKRAVLGAACSLLIAGIVWMLWPAPAVQVATQPKPQLGLMTSLPIYWNENADLAGMLDGDQPVHWVREQLEQEFTLVPLDALASADSTDPSEALAELEQVLLAQPAALPPAALISSTLDWTLSVRRAPSTTLAPAFDSTPAK